MTTNRPLLADAVELGCNPRAAGVTLQKALRRVSLRERVSLKPQLTGNEAEDAVYLGVVISNVHAAIFNTWLGWNDRKASTSWMINGQPDDTLTVDRDVHDLSVKVPVFLGGHVLHLLYADGGWTLDGIEASSEGVALGGALGDYAQASWRETPGGYMEVRTWLDALFIGSRIAR